MIFEKEHIEKVCFETIRQSWYTADDSFPDFLTVVSHEERYRNEQFLNRQIGEFQKLTRAFTNPFMPRFLWKRKWKALLKNSLEKEPILGIDHTFSSQTLSDMQEEFTRFFKTAIDFESAITMEAIGQAARNYLVYDIFTQIHQLPHNMTPSIFGYSMLYPYTDNYIDDPTRSREEKQVYNQLIASHIQGTSRNVIGTHEQKTCALLDHVLTFYEGEKQADIQKGLLLMLDAQAKSLLQTKKKETPPLTEEEIFRLSSYKGGISVLIDRFFVPRELTEADFIFYLSYGFFLQLADDLQDITEDGSTHRQTLFTMTSCDGDKSRTATTLNRLFHYMKNMLEGYSFADSGLKEFMEKGCCLLLVYSALLSGENFEEDYLKRFEPYLPVSLACIDRMKKEFSPDLSDTDLKQMILSGIS